jgi:putative peptidoglycan lipid II flippase
MFLKAGALSLALLLASRLLGLVRESAQAAAFGASGVADVAVLMLTLPDWIAGLLASGALAYVLVPAWAAQSPAQVAATQRKLSRVLVAGGFVLAVLLAVLREPLVSWLASGLPLALRPVAADALLWSAVALPAALLAALWTTRLQHESDFTGMYSANLVVNAVLIASIAVAGSALTGSAMARLGAGLLVAMLLRLAWLHWRAARRALPAAAAGALSDTELGLPAVPVWLWAALSAGLPLALPFVARSIASHTGEGALATFNYAWKLVELPLVLAIQLVAALAFPGIARASAAADAGGMRDAVRAAFALAWSLACAAAAGLLVGAPAVARLLFGWGRMHADALAQVAQWGATGAWGLLPQSVIAVALTVLAARGRMKIAVIAYAAALALLLLYALRGPADGAVLMALINILLAGVAAAVVAALGTEAWAWLPWRSMAMSLACLIIIALLAVAWTSITTGAGAAALLAAGIAAALVMAATWCGSADLRRALAR